MAAAKPPKRKLIAVAVVSGPKLNLHVPVAAAKAIGLGPDGRVLVYVDGREIVLILAE